MKSAWDTKCISDMNTLFISHGPPVMALLPVPSRDFLTSLGNALPRPEAVICVSAHWETVHPMVTGAAAPETIHDFYGFPRELYDMTYAAPGRPELARRIAETLRDAGMNASVDAERGLDHGAWIPLRLMYAAADIPVIQLSIQTENDPAHHLELGRMLADYRKEDILIMASGNAAHDLSAMAGRKLHDDPPDYVSAFDDWLEDAITAGDIPALLDYKRQATFAEQNHPFPAEHFLPLFTALGAAGDRAAGRLIHRSFMYGVLSMAAYAWE